MTTTLESSSRFGFSLKRSGAHGFRTMMLDTIEELEALMAYVDNQEPNCFSSVTLQSVAQNINATWTKSSHLNGRVRKIYSSVHPSAGSVPYALLLGYLVRGRINDYHLILDEKRKARIEES
jgi:hypothetical protein